MHDVIRRRLAGDVLSDADVLKAHPELLPELDLRLADLRLVELARLGPRSDDTEDETADRDGRTAGSVGRRIADLPFIPGFEIKGELHRGGQGVVFRAVQQSTHREVAVKVIRCGPLSGPHEAARFEREVSILARLNHPHIVTVFDSGATGGHYYYAMRLIEGCTITAFADGQTMTVGDTVRFFVKVCDAVATAHQLGIIHRDLKPGNILVDAAGEPQVLDFGLAKVVEASSGGVSSENEMTQEGQFMGTLAWAAPEQITLGAAHVDGRADQYALGMLLFRMVTGQMPYAVTGTAREVMNNVVNAEPTRPRVLLKEEARKRRSDGRTGERRDERTEGRRRCEPQASARAHDGVRQGGGFPGRIQDGGEESGDSSTPKPPRGLKPAARRRDVVDRELETILLKTLEKAPGRRYATVADFAADMRHWLNHEPIAACPPSTWYETRKFVQRNRLAVGAAAVIFLSLCGGLIGTSMMYVRAESQRQRAVEAEAQQAEERQLAEAARDEAEQVTQFLTNTLSAADPGKQGKDVMVRDVLDLAAQRLDDQFTGKPLLEARLRDTLGLTYFALGILPPAESHIAESAAIYTRELGPWDSRTRAAIVNYANVIGDRGGYAHAEALQRSTIEMERRVLGAEHPDTLKSMNNLANSLQRQGRYAEAAEILDQIVNTLCRLLGNEHPDTLTSMSSLAVVIQHLGRYAEAEALYRKILELERRRLGEQHPDTLRSMHGLAVCLDQQGRSTAAEELFRQTLEIQRRILGEQHPETLNTMNNMAVNLLEQGKYAEAAELFGTTLEIQRRVLGGEHPETLASLMNLASSVQEQGRYAEAEELLRETLEIQRRVLGEEHPHTLVCLNTLGNCLSYQRRYAEAEAMTRQTLEIQRRVQGEEHPNTLRTMNTLAMSVHSQGRYAESEELFRKTLEIQRRVLGEEHPDSLATLGNLANELRDQDRFPEAEELYRRTLEIQRRVLGDRHPELGGILYNLAILMEKKRELDEAESLCRQAADLWDCTYPPTHMNRNLNDGLLARILSAKGQFAEAEQLLRRSYAAVQEISGGPANSKSPFVSHLIQLYESWDAVEPGRGYADKAAEFRALLETVGEPPNGGS